MVAILNGASEAYDNSYDKFRAETGGMRER